MIDFFFFWLVMKLLNGQMFILLFLFFPQTMKIEGEINSEMLSFSKPEQGEHFITE